MAPKNRKGKSTTRDRIEALEALINRKCDDPKCAMADKCSHEGEREAAIRNRDRLMKKLKDQVKAADPKKADKILNDFTRSYGWPDHAANHVYGPRYQTWKKADTKDKAAQIKRDIMVARKVARPRKGGPALVLSSRALAVPFSDPIGDAPDELKYSVTSAYHGNGYSVVDITVSRVPAEWGWRKVDVNGHPTWAPTRALKELSAELGRLHWAYNAYLGYDQESDVMTGMEGQHSYHGGVEFENPDGHAVGIDHVRTAEDVLGLR